MASKTAGPGVLIWNWTVWSSLATTSTSEFHVPLLRIHRISHVPRTSLDVSAVPSLHVAPVGRVIVITALTSAGNTSSGAVVGSTVTVGATVGGAVVGGTSVAGGSVGAGVAPPHALSTNVNSTSRLKRTDTFLVIGFFSFTEFDGRWNARFIYGKQVTLRDWITSFRGDYAGPTR